MTNSPSTCLHFQKFPFFFCVSFCVGIRGQRGGERYQKTATICLLSSKVASMLAPLTPLASDVCLHASTWGAPSKHTLPGASFLNISLCEHSQVTLRNSWLASETCKMSMTTRNFLKETQKALADLASTRKSIRKWGDQMHCSQYFCSQLRFPAMALSGWNSRYSGLHEMRTSWLKSLFPASESCPSPVQGSGSLSLTGKVSSVEISEEISFHFHVSMSAIAVQLRNPQFSA